MLLSIVSPVYNAELQLHELINRIQIAVKNLQIDYEIILVDDYSPDNSWIIIEELAKGNPKIRGIKLSRNFGQHYAITAGLDQTNGDYVIVMDCDLQDRPEEIPNLYFKALEGYKVVLARREVRKDAFIKKLSSKIFYRVLAYLTGSSQDESIANFGIYHRDVIRQVCRMRERIRYFPTMVQWVGFEQTSINVVHASREEGSSNYNFKKLFNLALDIMLAYSDKPIRLTIVLGLFVAFTGFLFAIYTLILYFSGQIIVVGYASLIISIWLLSGLILATLGIVGLYIGKIFQGVKDRPIYIIDKSVNVKNEN